MRKRGQEGPTVGFFKVASKVLDKVAWIVSLVCLSLIFKVQ